MDSHIKILVFKTNLESEEKVETVRPILDENPEIVRWNIDQWDVDNVLRIETRNTSSPNNIIDMIRKVGFDCDELPD